MSREQDTGRVSEAYRDIARETSPANLDDRVMAMAAREARTRYGLARAWVRPVAWAATIGLSFAFILEMTYFSDEPPFDAAMPASPESDAIERAEPTAKEAPYKRESAPIVAAPEIRTSDTPARQDADESADAAAGFAEDIAPGELRRQRAAAAVTSEADRCEAGDRQSADTWYLCIQALRERGLEDDAEAELEALRKAFPDFREPVSE